MKKLSAILAVASAALTLFLTGCQSEPVISQLQPEPDQTIFKSADEAATAMLDAVRKNDTKALTSILGVKGRELVFSGEPDQDEKFRSRFSADASEKMSLSTVGGRKYIVVGKKDVKFPVPIVTDGSGWFFNTAEGRDELLNRRVVANELSTIKYCKEFVKAQQKYSYMDRIDDSTAPYAMKIATERGERNVVPKDFKLAPPLGPLLDAVAAEQKDKSTESPYKGYIYKVLMAQGEVSPDGQNDSATGGSLTKGFALLAYPYIYGETGRLTFIVTHLGTIYGKNMGEKSSELSPKLNEYNVDDTWTPVAAN